MKLLNRSFLAAAVLFAGLPLAASAGSMAAPTVHIKDFKFVPAILAVAPGTMVTFINDDQEPHTVTATNHSFDSEGLDTNQKWVHAFAKAGTFTYFCEMHPYMHGTITVKAAK
jgi:plastocyanin